MHKLNPPLTAAFDRGPSPYFHGRESIRNKFKNLLDRANASNSGTTFLIHGAPGAGKSALLYECERIAEAAEWQVAIIDPPSLWEVDSLVDSLGLWKELNIKGGEMGVSIPGFASAKVSANRSTQTVKRLLQKGKKPLLLILDEAQRLVDISTPGSPQNIIASTILNAIHNGQLNKPVVHLAAGLSPTLKAFQAFNISRFSEGCVVELGALSKESEHLVIKDWIKKDGRGKGGPSAWIDAIAQEANGWPRHVHSYAKHASEYLKANGGVMTPDGLNSVLEVGHEARKAYYKGRLVDFRPDEVQSLAMSIAKVTLGETLEYLDIIHPMAQKYGDDQAKELFAKFEEKGILKQNNMGYIVPIPSMHTWLIETFTREKIELSRQTQKIRVERNLSSGFQR